MITIRLMILLAVVLFTAAANAQNKESLKTNVAEFQSVSEVRSKAIADIAEVFKKKAAICGKIDGIHIPMYGGTQKNVLVLKDRIELRLTGTHGNTNEIIYWGALADYRINSYLYTDNNFYVVFGDFQILIKGNENGKKLFDALMLIHNQCREEVKAELAVFETIAVQYRTLKVKPPVSEEQRRYIVQANMYNQEKSYWNAIGSYQKVLELDQTSYPAAYSNLALLYAQVDKFYFAIYNMKKYLLLEPEATDARSAQDKIYEWEAKVVK